MDRSAAKPPLFNGMDYPFWKIRMTAYLQSISSRVWEICENERYEVLAARVGQEQIDQQEANSKARNALSRVFRLLSLIVFLTTLRLKRSGKLWKNIMRGHLMLRPDSLRLTGVSMRTLFGCLVSRSIRCFLGFR